jgi:hypothetical protein
MKTLRILPSFSLVLKPIPLLIFLLPAFLLIHCTSNGGSAAAATDSSATNSGGSGGSGSNTPAGCVQTASNPVANVTSLGGDCANPVLVDQGNGTVKDTANNLLWVKCTVRTDSVSGNTVVWESGVGNCNQANAATLKFESSGSSQASSLCNDLVYASRSDWGLPDLKQLSIYYKSVGTGVANVINSTLYGLSMYGNSSTQIYHITTTTGSGSTAGSVDFSRPTGSGGGPQLINAGTQAGIVMCVVKL